MALAGRSKPRAHLPAVALVLACACACACARPVGGGAAASVARAEAASHLLDGSHSVIAADTASSDGTRQLLTDARSVPTVIVVLHTPKAGGSTLSMLFKRLDVLGKGAYATHDCPGWDSVVDAAVRASAEATAREAPLRIVYEVHRTAKMVSPTFADLEAGVARLRDAGVRVVVAGLFRDPVRFFWSNFWDGHRHSWLKPLTDALGLCDALQKRPPGAPLPTFMCDDAPWEWSPTDPQAKQLAIWVAARSAKMPSAAELLAAVERANRRGGASTGGEVNAVGSGARRALDTGGGAGVEELDLLTVMTEQRYEGPTLRHARRVLDLIDVPIPVERQDEGLLALAFLAGIPVEDVSVPVVNAHHFSSDGAKEAFAFEERVRREGGLDGYFELDNQLVAEAHAKLDAVVASLGEDFSHSLSAFREHELPPDGWQARHGGAMWWQGGLPSAPRYEVCYVAPLWRPGGAQLTLAAGYQADGGMDSDDSLRGHFQCAPRRPCSCEPPPEGSHGARATSLEAALCMCASARELCTKLVEEAFKLPLKTYVAG